MALGRWQRTIQDASGNVVPGATVEVRNEATGLLATLFSDRAGTVPLGNPFAADGSGIAGFFAAGGAYRIDVTTGASTATERYVPVGTAAEHDLVPGNSASRDVGTTAGTVAAGDDSRFGDHPATGAEYRALTPDRQVETDSINDGLAPVALSILAGVVAWNMSAGIDFTLTLTANCALQNPTSAMRGKRGRIRVVQDATGGRTLSIGSQLKTPGGGGIVLSTAPNAVDYIDYDCVSSTETRLALSKDWA